MPPLPYCLVLRVHRTTLPSAHASLQSAPEMPHCRRTWCGRAHSFLCLYPGSAVPREQRELMSLICLIYALICWKAPCSSLWYFLGSSEAVLSIKTLETCFSFLWHIAKNGHSYASCNYWECSCSQSVVLSTSGTHFSPPCRTGMTLRLLFISVMALILFWSSCQCFLTEAKVFLSTR